MKLENMTYEEIELLSYTDLTYMLLKENKQPMNTPTIFRKICDLLNFDDDYYIESIGDYYTSLTIDKRFVLLENNEWDIRDHHSISITIDEDEDDDEDFIEDEEDVEPDEDAEESSDDIDETAEEFDDEIDEDLEDEDIEGLTILPEDELEE